MSVFSGGDVSGPESDLSGIASSAEGYASQAANLSPIIFGQGQNDIYPTALSQYQAGASGQVTPDQQAAINQTLQQMNLSTAGTYGNLGLGGSTMQTQDTNANKQSSLAQTAAFANQDESQGLAGLAQALGFENAGVGALGTAGNILGVASGAESSAGSLAAGQEATQLSALSSLGSGLGGKAGASAGAGAGTGGLY